MQPWKRLSEEVIFKRYRTMVNRTFELPNGDHENYDVKLEGNPVCTLALTANNEVVLARQFRVGPEELLLELPGGGAEAGEDFIAAASRELLEETGYTGKMAFVGTSIIDGYSTGLRYNYVATECVKIQESKLDPKEPIETVLMPIEEFRKHIRSGHLTDVTTAYLGLDFLGLL